jgi:hypothetical protein
MKKIISFSFLAIVLLLSCDTKDSDANVYKSSQDLTYFVDVKTTNTVVLTAFSDSEFLIKVGSTVKSSEDRSFSVIVDPASTAVEDVHFTILNSGVVVIPAGELVADLFLNLDYINLPNEGAVLILDLIGDNVHEPKATYTLNLSKVCPSFLEGEHSYVSSNHLAAGDPGCPGTSGTVVWTSLGDAQYATSDASFGLFRVCWNVPAGAVGTTFQHLCNSITMNGIADQYGDTYTYTIVSVNGPVMVIDWSNTYNDAGTATITREGGLDWQDELQTN